MLLFLLPSSLFAICCCYVDEFCNRVEGMSKCLQAPWDSKQTPWPRLPTDAELDTATGSVLSWLESNNPEGIKFDKVEVVKYTYCEGNYRTKNGELFIRYKWHWVGGGGEEKWLDGGANFILIYLTGENRFDFCLNGAPPMLPMVETSPDFILGFSDEACKVVSKKKPTEPTEEKPWETVIGTAAAAASAILSAASVLVKKSKGKSQKETNQKEKEKETVGYILQLSADRIPVGPGKPGLLMATAWRVNAAGGRVLASEAALTAEPPKEPAGLKVQPLSGQGRLQMSISMEEAAASAEVPMTVKAAAPGGATSATVTLSIESDMTVEFF
jgi:hypothetical protein